MNCNNTTIVNNAVNDAKPIKGNWSAVLEVRSSRRLLPVVAEFGVTAVDVMHLLWLSFSEQLIAHFVSLVLEQLRCTFSLSAQDEHGVQIELS